MQNKTILSVAFVLMILVQWFVPSKMIWDREDVLRNGNEYYFECKPIDPNDPFRGKYITLGFKEDRYAVLDSTDYQSGEQVFIKLKNSAQGFVQIQSILKEKPENMSDVLSVKTRSNFISKTYNQNIVAIDYPFDRFYMEESKAKPAENLYRKSNRDSISATYAVIMIKDGVGVIKDVMIDGVPIAKVVAAESR